VDQFVEAINGTENRDRLGLGMEGQMPAPRAQLRGSPMSGIDEPDDLRAVPGAVAQPPSQAAGHPSRSDEENAAGSGARPRQRRLHSRCRSARNLLRVIHESLSFPRFAVRGGCDMRAVDALRSHDSDTGTYHPWPAPLDSVFSQALKSTEPTLN